MLPFLRASRFLFFLQESFLVIDNFFFFLTLLFAPLSLTGCRGASNLPFKTDSCDSLISSFWLTLFVIRFWFTLFVIGFFRRSSNVALTSIFTAVTFLLCITIVWSSFSCSTVLAIYWWGNANLLYVAMLYEQLGQEWILFLKR